MNIFTVKSVVSQTLDRNSGFPKEDQKVKQMVKSCRVGQQLQCGLFSVPQMPPWPKERVAKPILFYFTGLVIILSHCVLNPIQQKIKLQYY